MKKYFVSFLCLMMTAVPFSHNLYAASPDTARYAELKNESYGAHPLQKMDVYLPANRTAATTRLLVLLHGGAWNSGDKTSINDFVKLLQHYNPALAIINANYRLVSPAIHLEQQQEDIAKLLDFVKKQSGRWGINSGSITLGGISAGAHLAMLYAYRNPDSIKINSVISIVGPAWFGDVYYTGNALFQPLASNLLGRPVTDTASYLQASPAHIATAAAPPTYMAYGGYDPLVPVSNAVYLDKRLTELGVLHQYRFFATEGHRFSPATYDTVAQEVVAFIRKYG